MFRCFSILTLTLVAATQIALASTVRVTTTDAALAFTVDGAPYQIQGVTFTIQPDPERPEVLDNALKGAADLGVNTLRTWGTGPETGALLDAAHQHGLKVMLGLWMEHGRDGREGKGNLNYADQADRKDVQVQSILDQVKRYKDHPALLAWGVGNEVILNIDSEEEKIAYAKYLERVCRRIKEFDPDHPVGSVSAWTTSVPYWNTHCPSLDFYGINAYGPAAMAIPDALKEHGTTKPYIVTEFGPAGAWDVARDKNDMPIEPSDPQKHQQIVEYWGKGIRGHADRGCLGGFLFNYGDDWNPTSIWLDLFVKGMRRPAYYAAREVFRGVAPEANRLQLNGMLVSPDEQDTDKWIRTRLEFKHPAPPAPKISFWASPKEGTREETSSLIQLNHEKMGSTDYRIQMPSVAGVYKLYAMAEDAAKNLHVAQHSIKVLPTGGKKPAVDTISARGSSAPSKVQIKGDATTGFQLLRNGQLFIIKGVGGESDFGILSDIGGNAIRTWGADAPDKLINGKRVIDVAHENNITVTVGIWLGHERHKFDYTNPEMLKKQRDHVKASVLKFRDHPALLIWGLGNEMEGPIGPGTNPVIWKEINYLARMIKKLDPHHPVMSVVANVNEGKVKAIQTYAPDLDILGVNAYGNAGGVGTSLVAAGWKKPYAITEYGLPGPWEVEHTSWGAPIEPSSREKAGYYFVTHNTIMEDRRQCFGAYAFLWGNKQEATASWFGMLLPGGKKLPQTDAMGRAWTGHWPANRAPILKDVDIPIAQKRVTSGQTIQAKAVYRDPEGAPLTYTWEIFGESQDRKVGGDQEQRSAAITNAILSNDNQGNVEIRIPSSTGPYRLFVTVTDGSGSGAIDNWPFYVE